MPRTKSSKTRLKIRRYDFNEVSYLRSENGIAAPVMKRKSGIMTSRKLKPSHAQCESCVFRNPPTAVWASAVLERIQINSGSSATKKNMSKPRRMSSESRRFESCEFCIFLLLSGLRRVYQVDLGSTGRRTFGDDFFTSSTAHFWTVCHVPAAGMWRASSFVQSRFSPLMLL